MEKIRQGKGKAEAAGTITSTVLADVGSQGHSDDDGSQRFVYSLASTKILPFEFEQQKFRFIADHGKNREREELNEKGFRC